MNWEPARPAPLDAGRQPPADRYCDVVLTGGVTDGIVYPWAVLEIARAYRLKNIGGTSVGAMAAALAAAAEYGRRHGRLNGFNRVLMELPERLAENIDRGRGKVRTRIFSLFQPTRTTRRIFKLFVALIGSGAFSLEGTAGATAGVRFENQVSLSSAEKARRPLRTCLAHIFTACRLYWQYTLVGLLYGMGAALVATRAGASPWVAFFVAAPATVLSIAGMVAYGIYRDLTRRVVQHDYGMCSGTHAGGVPEDEPSIIEWLHEGIQAAAGRPLDLPLTFRDLWNAPGGPSGHTSLPPERGRTGRSIDLRVVATNLSHARPYEFPQDGDDPPLYFEPSELRRFFPATVTDYLERHSAAVPNQPTLRELPRDRLPVIVAARLSLSFPLLFCAVPLWAIDHDFSVDRRTYSRCRFSDGGICSNFPIHMFDAAVPEWPTFGISLVSRKPYRQTVWLPRRHYEGQHDDWYRFDAENSLGGFLSSILYSAKDWNDKTAMRMPGVRDRVAQIALDAAGSLNLELTEEDMLKLAMWGSLAGEQLVAKFIDANADRPSPMWDEHRWVRFHTFLAGLRERVELIREATGNPRYGRSLSRQIADALSMPPLSGYRARSLRAREAAELAALLQALEELAAQFNRAGLPQPYQPLPPPSLRIRAPL